MILSGAIDILTGWLLPTFRRIRGIYLPHARSRHDGQQREGGAEDEDGVDRLVIRFHSGGLVRLWEGSDGGGRLADRFDDLGVDSASAPFRRR